MVTCSYDTSNISSIGMTFNKGRVIVYIRQQQLISSEIDGLVEIDDPETYTNCEAAYLDFKLKVLRKEHKSYYSQTIIF